MNTIQRLRIFGLSLLLLTGLSVQEKAEAQPGVSISFQTFYNELSPYGRWINSPQYGSVWTPNVSQGFQPYSTNGYWEVTEYGNTWVSDYDWGWAPFHYGRWSFDDYNGWFWIPGYEWGPAWVNWRSGGDYYGWAPLGPGMNVNISINIPSFWWVFVPQRYIATRNWYNYCAPRNRVTHIYNQTTIINNYYRGNDRVYAYGPRRDEMERVTRRNIPVRQIDVNQRGRVITDYSRRTYGYDAPDHNAPVYRSDRGPSNGRISRGDDNSGRSYPSNGRSANPGYERPGSDRSREYNQEPSRGRASSPDVYNNRGAEPNRPSNMPATEPRREYGNPSSGYDRGNRSERSPDYNSGRSGGEAPAVRSAPAERNSAPRNNGRSESRPENSNGGGRSERGSSRSPR